MAWGEGGVESGDGFGPGINSEFRRLQAVVAQFCARPDEPLRPHEIGEQMEHLAHVRDLLERELARLAGVFARTDEAERQGSNGEVEWLRHHGQMSFSRASELVVVGYHLGEMPQSSAALEAGRVGFGHLVHVARNARFCASSPQMSLHRTALGYPWLLG